jgi:hypothetical protein
LGWAACMPVPVAGIARVALDPVQIRVHPGSLATLLGLGDLMRLLPLSSPSEPQSTKRRLMESTVTLSELSTVIRLRLLHLKSTFCFPGPITRLQPCRDVFESGS